MDTLRKEQHEAYERLKVLYKEKDQLAVSYKEKKKRVDNFKEQLQTKIGEYSKLTENGKSSDIDWNTPPLLNWWKIRTYLPD